MTDNRATDSHGVEELRAVSARDASRIGELVQQLSSSASPPTHAELAAMVSEPANRLLVRRRDGVVIGMLTLVVVRTPTGVRAWIEDVVVDAAARKGGVGRALMRRALELAQQGGARTVDLTSRPSRVAANELYQRLGFVLRETNLYRFTPDS
jgi:ribosomal protein S18 acetylase RimI-like enzyme